MRKSRLMGSNKMYPVKWLRWLGPRPWSHHLELSPAQPATLAAIPRPVRQGSMLARSPEARGLALHVLCGFSQLLFLSFPCSLLFFQVWRETNSYGSPRGANTSFLKPLGGRDRSRPAEWQPWRRAWRRERRASGSGRRSLDRAEMAERCSQCADSSRPLWGEVRIQVPSESRVQASPFPVSISSFTLPLVQHGPYHVRIY